MKDSVIVLSGGMDSATLLYDYQDRIGLAICFMYGANHNMRESRCARLMCERLGIDYLEVPMQFLGTVLESSLLSGADAIPCADYDTANMKSTVVPFRNGIMLSVACGIAESKGFKYVMIGNHGGDHSIYPDCRPGFIAAMSQAMSEGTYENVSILAPYTDITKGEIAKIGKRLGMDYSLTYSCYKGGEKHCGECATCRERREAMAYAGIEDPTEYEK